MLSGHPKGVLLNGKSPGKLAGFVRAGQDGARATARYYSKAGKEEKSIVKASFFTGITGGVLWYVLIYYWAAIDFSSEQIGLMGGIGSAVSVITYLFGGYLADAIGRKKLFLVGLVSTTSGLLLFLTEKNLAVFTVGFALTSLGGSLEWPALTTLLVAKTKPVEMKFLYGVQGFVNQIGLTIATFLGFVGPPIMTDLLGPATVTGFKLVFLAASICAFVPIIYVLGVKEAERKPKSLRTSFNKRTREILFMYSLQNALIGFGAALVIPWLPVIFNQSLGASDTWVGMIITLSNVVIAVGWFVIPKFAESRGSVTLITVCQLVSIVPLILLPYSPTLIVLAVLYTVRSFLMVVPQPVLNAYVMNITVEEIRASFLSLSQLAWQVAFAGGYIIAGYLWANDYTKPEPFYYAGGLYIAASLVFFAYFRKIKESHELAQAAA